MVVMPWIKAEVISVKRKIIQVGGHGDSAQLLFLGWWCGVLRGSLLLLWGVSYNAKLGICHSREKFFQ
jgi:hypothetical protein